ncbi:TIGR04211 family SH3 domain-containing protein [Paraferrimonas sedimenticola]|uniref:SH3 domain protein n=1 Tax=Paraferrimonas sedimenticola TaxID=375674 RepID=A0AA37VU63_9GAMM|nr:TIGR04211 family SH3 domain-containing protein [Paraferrimonas sedimenticola]GLP95679.1 SH3 domain protein [Paraferrimonas sedimenticola]
MKQSRLTLLALAMAATSVLSSAPVAAEDGYISDDVYVYLQAGPSNQYRILGTVETGMQITLLGETQNDYTKVRDHKGREGWIPSEFVTTNPSFRARVEAAVAAQDSAQASSEAAQQQQQTLSTELAAVKRNLGGELESTQNELAKTKRALASALQAQQKAETELSEVRKDEQFAMWREGAGIVTGGILLGLLISRLPKPKRRGGGDRWM